MSITACNRQPDGLAVVVNKIITTSAVSSGSGLAARDGFLYIIGDDVEYLAKISIDDQSASKIDLYPEAQQGRISKPEKHDLEAATWGVIGTDTFLIAFGSGGISPTRDTLFAINPDRPEMHFKRSLHQLYRSISLKAGLQPSALNIEGATIAGDQLILLNRGKNLFIMLSWRQFAAYITDSQETRLPSFRVISISLPVIDNFPVGFSGVCTLNGQQLLFTASLEETTDFIQDGAVKGSYIGVLDIRSDSAVITAMTGLKNADGQPVTDKLESIEIISRHKDKIRAIAVADNDDGNSKLYYVDIMIPSSMNAKE